MIKQFNIKLINKIHHDLNSNCNIALTHGWMNLDGSTNFCDRFINGTEISELENILHQNFEDIYFSINSFSKKRKQENNIWHLNAFALDFDFYKIDRFKNYLPHEFYEKVIKQKLKLEPTAVMDSGRGLYVIYVFKNAPKHLIKTYKAIYRSFLKDFQKYGLDPNAMNSTQIIRLPNSYNSKSNTRTYVFEFNDTNYKISDFFQLLPLSRNEYISKAKNRNYYKKKYSSDDYKHIKFQNDMADQIIDDLKLLISLRNSTCIYTGYREQLIYIARTRVIKANGTIEEQLNIANELNSLFMIPLTTKELKTTKPYGKRRFPSISKIIEKLEINPKEQKELKILISHKDKVNRSNKFKRLNKYLNKTNKQICITNRRRKVFELKSTGLSNSKISKILCVHKSTIANDLNYIANNMWEFPTNIESYLKTFLTKTEINHNMKSITLNINRLLLLQVLRQ